MGKDLKGRELGLGLGQRKDGYYTARYKYRTKYTRTIKEAREALVALRVEVDAGIYVPDITLDEYFDALLDDRERRGEIKPTTAYNYQICKKHWRAIGNTKLRDIKRTDIKNVQALALRDGLSPSTVNKIIASLSMTFTCAVQDGLILVSPVSIRRVPVSLQYGEATASETIHRALTDTEADALLASCARIRPYAVPCMRFLLASGVRVGEMQVLTWDDVDEEAGVIHITKTVTLSTGGRETVGPPKSRAGVRDIPINKTIARILQDQKDETRRRGYPVKPSEPVFVGVHGVPMSTVVVRRILQSCQDELKHPTDGSEPVVFDRVTPHALRATFATRSIRAGVTPKSLQMILGHSSLSMTMDLYTHVLPEYQIDEMSKLDL